jgi:hypothetical protein
MLYLYPLVINTGLSNRFLQPVFVSFVSVAHSSPNGYIQQLTVRNEGAGGYSEMGD